MSDLSGMVNHRKNDSRGKFAQREALITNERVKQTEDEAERIHLTFGRMGTGYEIIASKPNQCFRVLCPRCLIKKLLQQPYCKLNHVKLLQLATAIVEPVR